MQHTAGYVHQFTVLLQVFEGFGENLLLLQHIMFKHLFVKFKFEIWVSPDCASPGAGDIQNNPVNLVLQCFL